MTPKHEKKKKIVFMRYMLVRDVSSCKISRYVSKLLSITAGVHTCRINFVYANNSKSKDKEYKETKYITEWQYLKIFSVYYKCIFEQLILNQLTNKPKKHCFEKTVTKFREICNLGIYSVWQCVSLAWHNDSFSCAQNFVVSRNDTDLFLNSIQHSLNVSDWRWMIWIILYDACWNKYHSWHNWKCRGRIGISFTLMTSKKKNH